MALRTQPLSNMLARNAAITDYEFWRALRRIEDQIYRCRRHGEPIPIELVYARRILKTAWTARTSQDA